MVVPGVLRTSWRRLCGAALAAVCCAAPGLGPNANAAEYLLKVWDTEDGLPNSSVTAIAQTPDGYLWVGTYEGVTRFDGVRFTAFDTRTLGQGRVQDLFVDSNGTLWINTYRGGLTAYREGVFRREWAGHGAFDIHTTLAASSPNEVLFVTQVGEVLRRTGAPGASNATWRAIPPPAGTRPSFQCVDREGTLWFLTRDGEVLRMTGNRFHKMPVECGLWGQRVSGLAAGPDGLVWAATDKEIARWEGGHFVTMTATNGEPALNASFLLPTRDGGLWVLAEGRLRKQVGREWVFEAGAWEGLLGRASGRSMGMHEDREGGVWFNHYGNGLFHISRDYKLEQFTTRDGLPGDRVWAWFEDREGSVWAGVDVGGLVKLRSRRFRVIDAAQGLGARAAAAVCQDEQGTMWFGTSGGGLSRWQEGKIENFAPGTGALDNFVFSVFPQAGQGLWLSAGAGEDLYLFRNGQFQRPPWELHGIKSILVDRAGRVWMGSKSGLNWWTPQGRRSFREPDGMPVSAVRALAEGKDGAIWCGNDDGTLYRCDPEGVRGFRPADETGGQPIWCLLADKEGVLWAGTFQGGLLRFKQGVFGRATVEQGLPDDFVCQILEDNAGQLWLGTHQGICRVSKRALNDCLDGQSKHVDCITYGRSDGLPTLECAGNYQPACWKAQEGTLWFATVKGVVAVNPVDLKPNPVVPPVVIEELRVDGERFPLNGERIVVPPGRKELEFRFTALSFVAPERVRFRYRLKELDKEWVEAGVWRVAQYRHLPAREYHFEVLACNSDGKWNNDPTTLAFTVLPRFYETWWFLGLMGAVVLGGVAGVVRISTSRKYRRALARLEQQHAIERDRTRIAKDIHDDLGAGLTQITLLTELARREPEQAGSHLERISNSARQMTRSMDEIVWAVDPQHDTVSGLVDYVSAFAEDFLRTAGLRCRMDLPAALPESRIDAETRYHLFLAVKEALNNVVKHARATEVRFALQLEEHALTLSLEDNGQGLPAARDNAATDRLSTGHGLPNLEQRLAAVGGRCRVFSRPGQGTRVEFTVRVQSAASPIMATGQTADREPELSA